MKPLIDLGDYGTFSHELSFDMAKHSTIGCGGRAAIAFCPQSIAEVKALLAKLDVDNIPYYVIGNMSNVLPPDTDTTIPLIYMKNLNGITLADRSFVYAGATSGALLSMCRRCGKSGAEFLSGIPCTFGGAIYMNAGAGGHYVNEVVENVLVYHKGNTQLISCEDCDFAYKHSIFMENGSVILGATLRLNDATETQIGERERYYKSRRAHLPKGKSMGCVFKNAQDKSAGDLIERSGLKGLRIGGAVVSAEHANFIINDGTATAKDIKTLVSIIKAAVLAQYGIRLEEEIRYIPF